MSEVSYLINTTGGKLKMKNGRAIVLARAIAPAIAIKTDGKQPATTATVK